VGWGCARLVVFTSGLCAITAVPPNISTRWQLSDLERLWQYGAAWSVVCSPPIFFILDTLEWICWNIFIHKSKFYWESAARDIFPYLVGWANVTMPCKILRIGQSWTGSPIKFTFVYNIYSNRSTLMYLVLKNNVENRPLTMRHHIATASKSGRLPKRVDHVPGGTAVIAQVRKWRLQDVHSLNPTVSKPIQNKRSHDRGTIWDMRSSVPQVKRRLLTGSCIIHYPFELQNFVTHVYGVEMWRTVTHRNDALSGTS